MNQPDELILGVIADTHIPERAKELHPQVEILLRDKDVSAIFHAGDVCIGNVLQKLETIAPVIAVRGNRDWVVLGNLPICREAEFGSVRIAVMHGHGGLFPYIINKIEHYTHGYLRESYEQRAIQTVPEADVYIFGHSHKPENYTRNGKLIFNPGSAVSGYARGDSPSIGFIHIQSGQPAWGEIVPLSGWKLVGREWSKI